MSEISEWLARLGLAQYADNFEANEIDLDLARDLDDAALEKLGVAAMGHRLRLIRALRNVEQDAAESPAPTPLPVRAERRQITVMFCDMVGSATLSEQLDPEDLREVMKAYQRASGDVIERYGGHVAQYLGDGLVVYFGLPQTREDDAQRAIAAGLELVANVKTLAVAVPLRVRVGIATGQVVVGATGGGDASVPDAAVGQTPNLAARIQGLAQPDEVLVAATTRQLAGGAFEYDDLGERDLKGISGRPHVWRVVAESGAQARFDERSEGASVRLIGRASEADLLMDAWQQARTGDGQVVLLGGEPGIGKSRLTQTLMTRLAAEDHRLRRFQCAPFYENSAFHPLIAHWRRAAEFLRGDSDDACFAKLDGALSPQTSNRERVATLLASLLSLRRPDSSPQHHSAKRQKDDTIDALVEQLLLVAREAPLLVLIEDLHWMDPSSLELLGVLVRRVRGHPVLLLMTHRNEFAPSWIDDEHVSAYRLNRLTRQQCAHLVAEVAARKALPDEVLDHIVAKSDGVPLFAEQMTRAILEAGFLVEESDRYVLSGALPSFAIPATLHESLMARLDRLPLAKEVACIGSVIGREFSHALLCRVAGLREADLSARLAALSHAQLVFTRGQPPEEVHFFKHALVQEVAYESLLKSHRVDLHRQIYETLLTGFPEVASAHPELLARHAQSANDGDAAADLWFQAGQQAIDRSAADEAIAHFTAGVEQVLKMEPSPERDQRELPFRASLGTAYMLKIGWAAPEAEQAYARANELSRSIQHADQAVWLLWGIWVYHFVRGEVVPAQPLAQRIFQLAEQSGERTALLVAHMILAQMALYTGQRDALYEHIERAEALYIAPDDQVLTKQYTTDLRLTVRVHRSHGLWVFGQPDRARVLVAENAAYARTLDHPYCESWTLTWGAMPYLFLGDFEELLRSVDRGSKIAEEHGFAYLAAMAAMTRGFAEAKLGAVERGIDEMRAGLEGFRATGAGIVVPFFETLLAELLVDANRAVEALPLLDAATEQIQRWGETWHEPEVHRTRGRAQEMLGEPDATRAEWSYRLAVDMASRQQMRGWELRARICLARWLHKRDRQVDALAELNAVLPHFTQGDATADLREAHAVLHMINASL